MKLILTHWPSPIAPLLLATDPDGRLRALEFADLESRMRRLLREQYGEYTLEMGKAPKKLIGALNAYFQGDLENLSTIPTANGGTAFQREVWQALRTIPAGTTMSYGQLANNLGRQGASRAVGAANGKNPIGIVVPCHRVIGANGQLTGYGGGLPRKRWLLEHESRYART